MLKLYLCSFFSKLDNFLFEMYMWYESDSISVIMFSIYYLCYKFYKSISSFSECKFVIVSSLKYLKILKNSKLVSLGKLVSSMFNSSMGFGSWFFELCSYSYLFVNMEESKVLLVLNFMFKNRLEMCMIIYMLVYSFLLCLFLVVMIFLVIYIFNFYKMSDE